MNKTYKLEDLKAVVNEFVDFLNKNNNKKIIAFYGEMGSGKTTLIKEICSHFGVKNEVTSPTFAIINEYSTNSNNLVYHFDFYRLKNLQEALDIGTEDYFYSGNYCFLEWPEKIEEILPENSIIVNLKVISDKEREIVVRWKIKNDFKEVIETNYWIRLMEATNYLTEKEAGSLLTNVIEIQKIIAKIRISTKKIIYNTDSSFLI